MQARKAARGRATNDRFKFFAHFTERLILIKNIDLQYFDSLGNQI